MKATVPVTQYEVLAVFVGGSGSDGGFNGGGGGIGCGSCSSSGGAGARLTCALTAPRSASWMRAAAAEQVLLREATRTAAARVRYHLPVAVHMARVVMAELAKAPMASTAREDITTGRRVGMAAMAASSGGEERAATAAAVAVSAARARAGHAAWGATAATAALPASPSAAVAAVAEAIMAAAAAAAPKVNVEEPDYSEFGYCAWGGGGGGGGGSSFIEKAATTILNIQGAGAAGEGLVVIAW